jgi:acyl-CoA thioesterase
MSIPRGNILRDSEPVPVDGHPGRFRVDVPEAWRIFYAFGGMTMACAIRAAEVALDRPDLRLVSAEATFCQAIPIGPCALDVEVLRSGRRGAQCHVRMWATDDPGGPAGTDLLVTVVFGQSRPDFWGFDGATFPLDARDPELCQGRLPDAEPSPFDDIPYHQQTDFRFASETPPWLGERGREPRAVTWFRFLEPPLLDDGTWEPATLAVPGDILGTAVHEGIGTAEHFMVISLQIGLQFLQPMSGTWLAQHARSHHTGDGYAYGTAELWSEDRRLVAFATQSALLRPFT